MSCELNATVDQLIFNTKIAIESSVFYLEAYTLNFNTKIAIESSVFYLEASMNDKNASVDI